MNQNVVVLPISCFFMIQDSKCLMSYTHLGNMFLCTMKVKHFFHGISLVLNVLPWLTTTSWGGWDTEHKVFTLKQEAVKQPASNKQ